MFLVALALTEFVLFVLFTYWWVTHQQEYDEGELYRAIRTDSALAAAISLDWDIGKLKCQLRLVKHKTREDDWLVLFGGLSDDEITSYICEKLSDVWQKPGRLDGLQVRREPGDSTVGTMAIG